MGIDSEIREALTNLIFNAVDAMPRGGTLTLRTKVTNGPGTSRANGNPQVHVEVGDNGSGMDEETRRRCQEPFFTTKGERGTGLGLAMVYGTAQRHGAEMDIQSAVGKGTTVRLSFPVPATKEPTEGPVVYALPSNLRLLIIDDDAVLLKSLRDTLQTDGHTVVTANGGQEGINLFSAARGENSMFDVVITDLGMPNVDGRKVAGAIKTISPTTPVILLTGWGHSLAMEAELPAHVDRVLSKPPRLAELRAALAGLTTAVTR
jgi:CheY-like chemotaxis protein